MWDASTHLLCTQFSGLVPGICFWWLILLLCVFVEGRKWWREHWELPLLPETLHDSVAERSRLQRHYCGSKEVSAVLSSIIICSITFPSLLAYWSVPGRFPVCCFDPAPPLTHSLLPHCLFVFPMTPSQARENWGKLNIQTLERLF